MAAFIEGVSRLRANSGLIAALSMMVLVLSLGFALFPVAQESWPKLRAITSQQQWSWSDVWDAVTGAPTVEAPATAAVAFAEPTQPDLVPLVDSETVSVDDQTQNTEAQSGALIHEQSDDDELLLCVPSARIPWVEERLPSEAATLDACSDMVTTSRAYE